MEGYVVLGRVSDGDEGELAGVLAGGSKGFRGMVGAYEEHVVRQDAVGGREPGSERGEHGGGVVGCDCRVCGQIRPTKLKMVPDGLIVKGATKKSTVSIGPNKT